jgi:hypothetical protein
VDTVRNSIQWDLLHRTAEHFQEKQYGGFRFIDVPWLVSERAIRSTFQGSIHEALPGQFAVGSAEQSFAQLLLDGVLDPTVSYIAISPCFRDEPVLDELHQKHFMKAELIQPFNGNMKQNRQPYFLAREAAHWFNTLANEYTYRCSHVIDIVQTEEGYDVTADGIEVGSYGIRHFEGFSWVYGTALAEPRFSTVMNKRIFSW